MIRDGHKFRVVEKHIPDICCQNDGLLGIVKVQMPEQCDESVPFRIRKKERARNISIIKNAIALFGKWSREVNAPTIILFPELSVTEEATDWLRSEMQSPRITPNTLIVLGMEQLTTAEFRSRVANSDSQAEFAGIVFPPNIDFINTAAILAKDNASSVFCYYQPKCSRSDYESPSQYTSDTVYELAFGTHRILVSICSDFLLRDDVGTLVGSVIEDMEPRPQDHRLDLILLIQKNASPFHHLYHESIKRLFYNRPHLVQTTDTIICAVNSFDPRAPGKFGKSNVSVMRRGRPPKEFEKRPAIEHYAWCSIKSHDVHLNEDLHYIRWRLRSAGAISFVLDTDRRPWPPGNLESMPVRNPGLHRVTDAGQLEIVRPVPEVYELQEALYGDFQSFIEALFQANTLRHHLGPVDKYEHLLNTLFTHSPRRIIGLLLALNKSPVNCDHWNLTSLAEAFRYFVVTLRLLSERYEDLKVIDDELRADARSFGILDCKQKSFVALIRHFENPANAIHDIDVLMVQQISELFPWDGRPASLETLNSLISTSNPAGREAGAGSITRAPSPQIADIGTMISNLNHRCERASDIRSVLNEFLRFT